MVFCEEISGEMLRLLADIGLVATGCGRKNDACNIFNSILSARPNNEYVYIAYAFMRMSFAEYSEASKLIIEGALKVNPESEIAKAFYGLLLYNTGQRDQGFYILDDIKSNGKDHNSIELAEKIIMEG